MFPMKESKKESKIEYKANGFNNDDDSEREEDLINVRKKKKGCRMLAKVGYVVLAMMMCQTAYGEQKFLSEQQLPDYNLYGNYKPYTYDEQTKNARPPKGYKPFYISHYGRHGSRYHYSSTDYKKMSDIMDKADSANALTEKGKEVKKRLDYMTKNYSPLAGDLTQKGVEQHKGIAQRMVENYPMLFRKNAKIDVKSSTVTRCLLSMDAFCQQLRVERPKLNIINQSSKSFMPYLSSPHWVQKDQQRRMEDTVWTKANEELYKQYVHPERMIRQLFSDSLYVAENINPRLFMHDFYTMTCSLVSNDSEVNFDDVWTYDEFYGNWVVQNAWWYGGYGPCLLTQDKNRFFAKALMTKILDEAEETIKKVEKYKTKDKTKEEQTRVHLRFGHDTALLPLITFLNLREYNVMVRSDLSRLADSWHEYDLIPMAGNLQFVFYKKKNGGEILVRVMLNEKDVRLPLHEVEDYYYKWEEVLQYYRKELNEE